MKFVAETQAFVRVLEMLRDPASNRKARDANLRLSACQGRVSVRLNGIEASLEALVWEEGQSSLSFETLLNLLRTLRGQPNVLVQADARGLRIQQHTIPVLEFSGYTRLPDRLKIYMATDVGMVPSTVA